MHCALGLVKYDALDRRSDVRRFTHALCEWGGMVYLFMVFNSRPRAFHAVSPAILHATRALDEDVWHYPSGMQVNQYCNPIDYRSGYDANTPTAESGAFCRQDSVARNIIMVPGRYDIHVQQWQTRPARGTAAGLHIQRDDSHSRERQAWMEHRRTFCITYGHLYSVSRMPGDNIAIVLCRLSTISPAHCEAVTSVSRRLGGGLCRRLCVYGISRASYSGSAKAVASIVLSIINDCSGIDTSYFMGKLSKMGSESPLYLRLLSIFTRPVYASLLLADVMLMLIYIKSLKRKPGYVAVKHLSVLAVGIPLLMVLAGRFQTYYFWMAYLPLFLLTVMLFRLAEYRWACMIIAFPLSLALAHDITKESTDNHYKEQEYFMRRCTMLRGKKIIAPFSVFYEASRLSDRIYYLGIYPPRFLPSDIDYIILPERTADYGNDRIYKYLEDIGKTDSATIVLVAESKQPELKVYRISK